MGFNVTALAQKARTQTLIVDSNLDMGQYDVIATDVKGDTAEFSEFVGGVGNFESGLISGGLDVGDILHAKSSMQIDGDLVVEGYVTGSISGGTVAGSTGTFSGAVTGASFNGVKIKTHYTVTPNTNIWALMAGDVATSPFVIFPFSGGTITYSGSLTLKNSRSSASSGIVCTSANNYEQYTVPANGTLNISFNNISYLAITGYSTYVTCSGYTLS